MADLSKHRPEREAKAYDWWLALDRCAAACGKKASDEDLIRAESLRKAGETPWAAAGELWPRGARV